MVSHNRIKNQRSELKKKPLHPILLQSEIPDISDFQSDNPNYATHAAHHKYAMLLHYAASIDPLIHVLSALMVWE